ncbi:hypothetical protein Tco_0767103 [Tanacetum coccineum]
MVITKARLCGFSFLPAQSISNKFASWGANEFSILVIDWRSFKTFDESSTNIAGVLNVPILHLERSKCHDEKLTNCPASVYTPVHKYWTNPIVCLDIQWSSGSTAELFQSRLGPRSQCHSSEDGCGHDEQVNGVRLYSPIIAAPIDLRRIRTKQVRDVKWGSLVFVVIGDDMEVGTESVKLGDLLLIPLRFDHYHPHHQQQAISCILIGILIVLLRFLFKDQNSKNLSWWISAVSVRSSSQVVGVH